MEKLEIFLNRMKKLGINMSLVANYPWIYLISVNGNFVTERNMSDHCFTVMLGDDFTDLTETFKIIRKYK